MLIICTEKLWRFSFTLWKKLINEVQVLSSASNDAFIAPPISRIICICFLLYFNAFNEFHYRVGEALKFPQPSELEFSSKPRIFDQLNSSSILLSPSSGVDACVHLLVLHLLRGEHRLVVHDAPGSQQNGGGNVGGGEHDMAWRAHGHQHEGGGGGGEGDCRGISMQKQQKQTQLASEAQIFQK